MNNMIVIATSFRAFVAPSTPGIAVDRSAGRPIFLFYFLLYTLGPTLNLPEGSIPRG